MNYTKTPQDIAAQVQLLQDRGLVITDTLMKFDVEKMRRIARPSTDKEKALRRYRRDNAEWLNASAKIALNIRAALRSLGITQTELAQRMEVTPAQVTKILSGKENLGLKTIYKIEEALGVEIISVPTLEFA